MNSTPADNHEQDYRRVVDRVGPIHCLPGTGVEILCQCPPAMPPRHVLFDFDGTLSLIREGWTEVMIPLMVEVLKGTGSGESAESLSALCREFVGELTGKQTIYQMIRLAEEVTARCGTPRDPLDYKQEYLDRLGRRIATRHEDLRNGRVRPAEMLVPGSLELLDALRARGATLYLASGTDEPCVVEEVELLGLGGYFGSHVYGALDDYKAFSKAQVIERILAENRVEGASLLGFGDGYVEIQNVKSAGGVAVAVASDEAGRSGKPAACNRARLMGAGADLVVPDYRDCEPLLKYLWTEA